MIHNKQKQGFTLVELMLAMGFVSALLLAIAMTVIQIGNIYNRGITFKTVNQTGGALASELLRDINSSSPFDVTSPKVYIQQGSMGDYWGGRLCIGQYSFIWNYGKYIQSAEQAGDFSGINAYSSAPNTKTPINFIKVIDPTASYCIDATTTKKEVNYTDAVELLDVGESNLAIHNFSIMPIIDPLSNTGQSLYNISFKIGTDDQTTLTGSGNSTVCLPENNINSNPSYCAVNQFDILARAGNRASE